jgi:hypothetical protein
MGKMTVEELVAERLARIRAEETQEQKDARARREEHIAAVAEADALVEAAVATRVERLKEAVDAGVTKEDLARVLGKERTTIYRWLGLRAT